MAEDIVKIEENSYDVVYQQDRASIDTMIATAKAYPRNIKRSKDNATAIATMDVKTASTCTYSVPRGGKQITGPSVHLAKILAQSWGNMRIEAKVVNVDDTHVTSQAVAFDLENNLAIKVEVKRSIRGKGNVRFNEDMITVTGNAGNSIALRNAILAVIPRSIVDSVYESATKTITGDLTDETKLIKKRKQVLDGFKETYSVSEKEVLDVIGKASIEHIGSEEIVVLIGIAQSIKDGNSTVDGVFRPTNKKSSDNSEHNRVALFIEKLQTVEDAEILRDSCETPELITLLEEKIKNLKK